jgi:germacradienol/geosmin synthase
MRQFERIVATELPALCDRHHLTEEGRQSVGRYVAQLQDFMAAHLNWHSRSGRYTEHGLRTRYGTGRRRVLGGPSSLGTAAARMGWPGYSK